MEKGRQCVCAIVLYVLDKVCGNAFPCDSSVNHACSFPIFTSMVTEYLQKRFPMCLIRVGGKMTQQDHLISQFPFLPKHTHIHTKAYSSTVPSTVPLTKSATVGPEEEKAMLENCRGDQ